MSNINPILILLIFPYFIISCMDKIKKEEDIPTILAGKSYIYGQISAPDSVEFESLKITINTLHPISGEFIIDEVLADPSGHYSFDLDVETNSTIVSFRTSLDPQTTLMIKTFANDSTRVDIQYDTYQKIKNVDVLPYMNKYDMRQGMEVFNKIVNRKLTDPSKKILHLYNKSIDEFLGVVKRNYSERIALFVDSDDLLTKEFKDFIAKDYRLFLYRLHVFNYEVEMKRNYRNTTQDTVEIPKISKRDRSYFRFLKDFNLNDPQYLHAYTFPEFQDSILHNKILGLPSIGEKPINDWIAEVKNILSELVGFDEGPYYDILAANALGTQLTKEKRPFSEKQIENISKYWKDGEIPKILFRKNEVIIKYDELKSPAVVHDVASVPKEKVLDAILANHQNKVVFMDFWASWCAPCLVAMKQFDAVKGDYSDKNVAFVYLTNGSSPKDLWDQQIIGIGNEHYYLSAEQWEYLMDQFEFTHIPSYVLIDDKGEVVDKFISFPGNQEVQNKLDKLLQ